VLFFACTPSKEILETPIIEFEDLDTMVISAPKPAKLKTAEEFKLSKYNPSHTRIHDLIHTKLELNFDWKKQHVLGKASLTLKPYFYPSQRVVLDAKGFDIHKINFANQVTEVKYDYDDELLTIDLGREYSSKEEYTLVIEYTAKPAESTSGGSAAITSDQGLFFINHDGQDKNKPMQIWTQGETEWNSRWFPTIDKPNERCTQEMYITVDDKFKTLSNGLLVSSNKNTDGTRTDYWKMDQPHAPYLFMLTVGEFAVVKDKWRNIDVDYYVEEEYKNVAKQIFSNTPEMLDFFSKKLGVDFPWSKYSQIIVRDYVSGAMENTTGVIFGEFVQKTERELIDNHNEAIIAHELFHHWFGDYVTCESWANLTMNEGFANYSEYLWFEHKYGADAAEYHRLGELRGYQASAQRSVHPLIYFGYEDKEDMFDAHSYNKGGLVLHMLRKQVGDEAFFASLKKYLTDHKYGSVEAHDLRLAFEEVTGQDLNWFFDQWFFASGHPILNIDYDYNAAFGKVTVNMEQTQNPDRSKAIFQLPMAIDIYIGKRMPIRKYVTMTERKQSFSFEVTEKPLLVNVDADKVLLCEKNDNKNIQENTFQYNNAKNFFDRYEAMEALTNTSKEAAAAVSKSALKDPYWVLRGQAIDAIEKNAEPSIITSLLDMAKNDKHSQVRAAALEKLGELEIKDAISVAKNAVNTEKSYRVISSGLQALVKLDNNAAISYAKKLESEENSGIISSIGEIYASSGKENHLPFFEKNWNKVDGYNAVSFFDSYLNIIVNTNDKTVFSSMEKLKGLATNMIQSPWRRLAATKAMNDMRSEYQTRASKTEGQKKTDLLANADTITKLIEEIKSKEENDQLKDLYNNY